jgi:flagellar hook-associated protein 3 FlgL
VTRSIQDNFRKFFEANEVLASGKKINTPSDDPVAMARIMGYKVDISSGDRYLGSIDKASSSLGFTDKILDAVSQSLSQAKQLAEAGTNKLSPDEAAAYSREAAGLTDFLLSLSNSQYDSRYIFSGFKTNAPAFTSALVYQGDNGIVETNINGTSKVATNVVGTDAFAYARTAADAVQLDDGRYIHYIPGAGTTTNVEIRASDDVTVLDSFSYDNFMQATQILENALSTNDSQRTIALIRPLSEAVDQVTAVRGEISARMSRLDAEKRTNQNVKLLNQNSLSLIEDADPAESIMNVQQAQLALQTMMEAGSKIMSQSLMDFLK